MAELKQMDAKQQNFTAVIFDFNGVLWWDKEIIENAAQATFAQLKRENKLAAKFSGKTKLEQDELDSYLHGVPNEYFFTYLLGRKPAAGELKEFITIKDAFYMQGCEAARKEGRLQLSPGAINFLNYLKANKIPLTIATSSHAKDVDYFFQHLNLEQWFDRAKVAYDDGTVKGKPAPDIYRKAAKMLKVPPERCIVIEDAISGIKSANAADIGMIIGLGPREKHANLRNVKDDRTGKSIVRMVITNIGEVPHYILQLPSNDENKPLPRCRL